MVKSHSLQTMSCIPLMSTVYPSSIGYFEQVTPCPRAHVMPVSSTVTRSQSNREPLRSGEMGTLQDWICSNCTILWCQHGPESLAMFPAPCWIHARRTQAVMGAKWVLTNIRKAYLIKRPCSVILRRVFGSVWKHFVSRSQILYVSEI